MPNFSRKYLNIILLSLLIIFLPWLENDQKSIGYFLLVLVSGIISLITDWKKIRLDIINLLFLLFLFVSSVSTVLSLSKARSFFELLRYLSYFLIFVNIRTLPLTLKIKLKKIYIFSIIINSILLSVIAWSFVMGRPLLFNPGSGMNLYYKSFGHNKLVDILLFSIPIVVMLFIKYKLEKHILYRILSVIFIFLISALLITVSKSGYMIVITMFILIGLYVRILEIKKYFSYISFIILPVFLLYFLSIISSYSNITDRYPLLKIFYKPMYLDYRWDYMRISVKGLSYSPLFGMGLDNYRIINKLWQEKPYSWSTYGENHYLLLLTETGIFGGVIFSLIIILSLYTLFQTYVLDKRYKLEEIGILLALLASALHVFFSVDWQFLSIFLFFWTGLALLLPGTDIEQNGQNQIFVNSFRIISILLIVFGVTNLASYYFYTFGIRSNSNISLTASSKLGWMDFRRQMDIGRYYFLKKDDTNAFDYYTKSARLDPYNSSNYYFLGLINFQNEDIYNGTINYQKAVSLNPKELQLYLWEIFRNILKETGKSVDEEDIDTAIKYFRWNRNVFPKFTETVYGKDKLNIIDEDLVSNKIDISLKIKHFTDVSYYMNSPIRLSDEEIQLILKKIKINGKEIIDIISKKS